MDQLTLAKGAPSSAILRTGESLYIVNAPAFDYDSMAVNGNGVLAGVTILVGFDHVPSIGVYDALVPPFAEAIVSVPETVQRVYLLWPSDIGAQSTAIPNPAAVRVNYGWLACHAPPGIRPLPYGRVVQAANQRLLLTPDAVGGIWPPGEPERVLDQARGTGSGSQHTRPRLAPSILGTLHVVTVINTLFDFVDPFYGFPTAGQPGVTRALVVHRIWVSVSAATLLVIGQNNLTVGAPGNAELWRGLIPAGQALPIDFGPEGIELNVIAGVAGAWRAYTAAAVTVDATIMGG